MWKRFGRHAGKEPRDLTDEIEFMVFQNQHLNVVCTLKFEGRIKGPECKSGLMRCRLEVETDALAHTIT